MNEQTKSLIRHILTALGTILALVGLNSVLPVVEFLQSNLDGIWEAIITIVGFITALLGFFTEKDRFKIRADAKK